MIALVAAALAAADRASCMAPIRLDASTGVASRWGDYVVGGVGLGAEVPLTRTFSAVGGVRAWSAGARPIWIQPFESTLALAEAQLGARWRLDDPGRRWTPVVSAYVYGIPRVEAGLAAEAGAELWFGERRAVGARLVGGAAWSPGRPLAPGARLELAFDVAGMHLPWSNRNK